MTGHYADFLIDVSEEIIATEKMDLGIQSAEVIAEEDLAKVVRRPKACSPDNANQRPKTIVHLLDNIHHVYLSEYYGAAGFYSWLMDRSENDIIHIHLAADQMLPSSPYFVSTVDGLIGALMECEAQTIGVLDSMMSGSNPYILLACKALMIKPLGCMTIGRFFSESEDCHHAAAKKPFYLYLLTSAVERGLISQEEVDRMIVSNSFIQLTPARLQEFASTLQAK